MPAPDVMSNAQHMLWMLDEYETITGGHYPGGITGKARRHGWITRRTEATGYGVIYTLREALRVNNIDIKSYYRKVFRALEMLLSTQRVSPQNLAANLSPYPAGITTTKRHIPTAA